MTEAATLDRDGRTPLHYAAFEDDAERARELIAAGADVNAQDKRGYTPLHFAAQQYSVTAAEVLLQAGAAVDAEDRHGNTPLRTAVFNSQGRGKMIELLRQAGADPHHRNHYGKPPLDLARLVANYDIAQYFADLE